MAQLLNFMFSPGREAAGGSPANKDDEQVIPDQVSEAEVKSGIQEDKPILEKIKEALQDWSNKDEADQELDDTRV